MCLAIFTGKMTGKVTYYLIENKRFCPVIKKIRIRGRKMRRKRTETGYFTGLLNGVNLLLSDKGNSFRKRIVQYSPAPLRFIFINSDMT
jgi:hypothetical protein